ncbi:oil body-associated protein 2B-like [Wolffia australiana]
MASSDERPGLSPMVGGEGAAPPGKETTAVSAALDAGAAMIQSMKPIGEFRQHACTFALCAHDPAQQIEVHHFVSRLTEDVLQSAVYDSDLPSARLIGVEYIVSERVFEGLEEEEKKLWHSHAYEVKAGLWVCPRVPEALAKPELRQMAKSYGKFWCTWQVHRGDRLPMGAPALMVSPQAVPHLTVKPDRVKKRDDAYRIASDELKQARVEMEEAKWIDPSSDHWVHRGKGLALDVVEVDMNRGAPFP